VYPAEKSKLLFQISLLQGHHKAHEPDGVQSEADDSMVGRKREHLRVREHDVLRRALDHTELEILTQGHTLK
jgi:hypothetical protein